MIRDDLLEDLWATYPQHCVVLTDPKTRRAIDAGIERAARHGFVDADEVRSYIRLMVFMGSHFDEDPQLAWAGEQLRRTANASRSQAMDALLAEVLSRMEPIIGPDGGYYRRALAWVQARSFETLVTTYGESDEALHTLLRRLHGRKYEALGDESVDQLIARARVAAADHGLTTSQGLVVYLALMFLLGSGIDRDPFHPWVNATLAAQVDLHPNELARLLHARSIVILRRYTRLRQLMYPNEAGV